MHEAVRAHELPADKPTPNDGKRGLVRALITRGADHVAIQILTAGNDPMPAYQRLAQTLL